MSSWSWDVNDDEKVLKNRHAELEKQIKNAPDATKHKAKKDNIDRQINEKKLEYAQKQFDLEQMKLQLKAARDKFQYHLQQQKEEAKVKDKHFQHLSSAKSTLNSKFSGSKIRDPDKQKKQVEDDIRDLHSELQFGDHRTNGEKMIIRTIEMKKQELEIIQGYIDNNVGQYQKEYEATAKNFSGVMATWKEKVKKTDDASKEREVLKKETERVNEEKNEISEEIKELASSKQGTQKQYQKNVKGYEKNRREFGDITVAIAMKKNRRLKARVNERESKDIREKQEQHKAAEEVKKEKKREEEMERQKATDVKRAKAIEAYNNMQKKLKAKNTSVVASRPSYGGAKKQAVSSNRVDPHAAEKEICRSLIVLCQSMAPTGRKGKKKKKVRLVYRADSFVKFNQVGVKIPKYAKNLDGTIKALQEKIASYDEPVPVKEEATEEEPTEEEPAPTEEEPVKEEPATEEEPVKKAAEETEAPEEEAETEKEAEVVAEVQI